MTKFHILLLFSIYLAHNATAYSGTIRPDVDEAKYIQYAAKYNCVGKLRSKVKAGLGEEGKNVEGTATLINKNWIITAAHIAYYLDKDSCIFYLNNKSYHINKIIINDQYNNRTSDMRKNFGDIALVRLDEEIILDKYPDLYTNNTELKKQCDLVGYGVSGIASQTSRKNDGIKRAGTNIIDEIIGDKLKCIMGFGKDTDLEFCIAFGDSGGPLFINGKIAGIHSFVDGSGNFEYGDMTYHTRISEYADWIKNNSEEIKKEIEILKEPVVEKRTWFGWFSSFFYSEPTKNFKTKPDTDTDSRHIKTKTKPLIKKDKKFTPISKKDQVNSESIENFSCPNCRPMPLIVK